MTNRKSLVGEQIDGYSITAELGSGSYGIVYQANELKPPHRQVALKLMREAYLGSQERSNSFSKEAQILKQLKHVYILPILNEGIYGNFPYMVTMYAPNGSLRKRFLRELGRPLPIKEALIILWQIGQALDYIHEQNLMHLDLKPENILFDSQGHALLADFSVATIRSTTGTQTVDMVGTATYMSPEQFRAKASKWSDQYALGCIAYELFTGHQPFVAFDFIALGFMHTSDAPIPLRHYNTQLPPHIEHAVLKAMSKQREDRYRTILDFITALYPPTIYVPGASSPSLTITPTEGVAVKDEIGPSRKQESDLFKLDQDPEAKGIEKGQVRKVQEEQVHQAEGGRPPRVEETEQPRKAEEPGRSIEEQAPSTAPLQLQVTAPLSSYQGNPFNVAPLPSNPPLSPPLPHVKRNLNLRLTLPILLFLTALIGGSISFFIISNSIHNGANINAPVPAGFGTIKIATDFPVSGKDTSSGKPAENGAHMAVDEANSSNTIPGYKLVFVPKDDVGPSGTHDPAVGAQNVTALIGDALVAGIVGPFNSNVAQSEMPIANQAPIALISPSNTNQCLTQTGADIACTGANNLVQALRPTGKVTYFRIATTDNHQGPANADYLYKTEHYKTAYAIDDAETYGIGIANTFSDEWTKLGGTILGRSSEPGMTTSFVSLLTQIASKEPDVIYFGGTDATGGTLIRQQMQQVPTLANTPYAGGDGIVTAHFASTIGLTGGPVFGTVASSDVTKNPAAATFVKNYTATYGPLGAYSAAGYDCAKILIQAIKTAIANGAKVPKDSSDAAGAKTFRQAVIDAMQKTDYTGLTGHHTFDSNGDTTNKTITEQQLTMVDGKPGWKVLTSMAVQ